MERIPRKPQRSLDGFIPSQHGRHVGFTPSAKLDSPLRDARRIRRPSSYERETNQQPSIGTNRQTMAGFTPRPTNSHIVESSKPKIGDEPRTRRADLNTHFERPYRETRKPKGKLARLRSIRWKKVIKRTSLAFAVLAILSGGWLGWKVIHNTSKVFGGSSNLLGFLNSTKLNGEDQGRVNILLTGVSTDDPGHNGADLTDSIMIISLDTRHNNATLLSIPRDLWVNIPGNGYAKINAANAYGDMEHFSAPGYPSGGIGLLEEVLHQDLNLNIQYYANIDYSAIRDGVNAVGGINVTIKSEDPRGLYDPSIDWSTHGPLVKLSNGTHHLDGEQALDLARARGDAYGSYGFAGSDFTRTENQRKMLIALKEKAASPGVIANPIKLGELFDALGKNVKTNFKTSEIRRLYDLSKQISSKNITSASLNNANGTDLLASYKGTGGQLALIPAAGINDFSQIQKYIAELFSNNPIVKEGAKVVILNGGNINGLAAKEKNILTNKKINVVSIADAPATAQTTIVDLSNGNMPNTKQELTNMFGDSVTTRDKYGYPTADFIVVLGANQKDPTTSSSQ